MDDLKEVLIDIRERLVRVETKIDDSIKDRMDKQDKRIDKLEDNQTWLWRTTIGSIIGAIITFIIKWGK